MHIEHAWLSRMSDPGANQKEVWMKHQDSMSLHSSIPSDQTQCKYRQDKEAKNALTDKLRGRNRRTNLPLSMAPIKPFSRGAPTKPKMRETGPILHTAAPSTVIA